MHVEGFVARRSVPGTNIYQVGVRLLSKDGQSIKNVSVERSKFDGFYIGHSCDNVVDAVYGDIIFRGNEFTNCVKQGGVALISSGDIDDNLYTVISATSPALVVSMCATVGAGGVVRIRNNRSNGPKTSAHFLIGSGYVVRGSSRWEVLELCGNVAEGGTTFASLGWDKNSTDYINILRVSSNVHNDAMPGGVGLTIFLNRTTRTMAFVEDNAFNALDKTLNAIQHVNPPQIFTARHITATKRGRSTTTRRSLIHFAPRERLLPRRPIVVATSF